MVGIVTLPYPVHLVREEAFGDGIVPAIAFAAHAAEDLVAG